MRHSDDDDDDGDDGDGFITETDGFDGFFTSKLALKSVFPPLKDTSWFSTINNFFTTERAIGKPYKQLLSDLNATADKLIDNGKWSEYTAYKDIEIPSRIPVYIQVFGPFTKTNPVFKAFLVSIIFTNELIKHDSRNICYIKQHNNAR